MGSEQNNRVVDSQMMKVETGDYGYVLKDVPHLTDYMNNLPIYPNPLRSNPAYSVVKQYFVNVDDTVPQKVVVHKDSPRGTHFRRAGPRQRVYFSSDEVHACIVTCDGLCPGVNTVIREIVCALYHMYGVTRVLGIEVRRALLYSNAQTERPKRVPKIVNLLGSPKQPEGRECGYVVMRYMRDIIFDKEMSFLTKWAMKTRKSYTMEELDEVHLNTIAYIEDMM